MAMLALPKSTIAPLRDRVLLKIQAASEKTVGGIFLPDTVKEKPQIGTVVAVGTGKRNDDGTQTPMEVKVNEKVLYSQYAGTELKLGDEDYILLSQQDILATVV
ncbi:co-chaperone GroES [Waterburya agarophytonicola K14]|uniref:Co-chaperonin GroES n=1 Tax=Waterburya agarophytonicola KI4 TaxID=2874699 RepID=A0A964FL66_9CYAN|nr:co-chaperone GroES [Waterburya agarophytonicola]MCC0179624.1 co-chaperone GroES [Waterburya agarophytonicola KI4]